MVRMHGRSSSPEARTYPCGVNILRMHYIFSAIIHSLNTILLDASFNCPCISGASIVAESGPPIAINDTAVDALILAVDSDGNVVDEIVGVMMMF